MARPRTSFELERLAAIAKRRETARATAKLTATPKAYVAEEPGGSGYFRSIENENLFVQMPIPSKAGTALFSDGGGALGGLTLAEVQAIANSSVVDFKGNHKQVLRIRFTRLKATPTTKITPWGTRVVDHTDDSVTVPFFGPADGSLRTAKANFATFTAAGPGATAIGTRKGNRAELLYNNRVLAERVV